MTYDQTVGLNLPAQLIHASSGKLDAFADQIYAFDVSDAQIVAQPVTPVAGLAVDDVAVNNDVWEITHNTGIVSWPS